MTIAGIDITAIAKELEERKEWHRERTQPIDRPYGAEVNERAVVVPVSLVVMALHIIAARIALKDFAGSLQGWLEDIRARAANWGAGTIIGSAGKAVGRTGAALRVSTTELVHILDADLIELSKEVAIRRNCWAARRDVFKLTMSQKKHRRRKTKLVCSRHQTPKQRKPNKSWRQPR